MKRLILAAILPLSFLAACAAEAPSGAKSPPSMTVPNANASADAAGAKSEFRESEIELSQAQNNCASACKALASMERATDHLCAAAASEDDRKSCADAQKKLASSRERVRSECGECAK